MTPKELAVKIFAGMTDEEKATAQEYGAGDMQDRVAAECQEYNRGFIVATLDELDRLCGCTEGDE